jgi:hypothetical protein
MQETTTQLFATLLISSINTELSLVKMETAFVMLSTYSPTLTCMITSTTLQLLPSCYQYLDTDYSERIEGEPMLSHTQHH